MDRSFLSQPEVIAAAQNFVCIRLTSYEDETEKQFVSKLVRGEVANTAFAILTPDAKPALTGRGPGRGPRDLFEDAAAMAKGMDELAKKYPPKKAEGAPSLPVTLTAKVGMAVAAGDFQPLIVVVAEDTTQREAIEAMVAEQAWGKAFAGRFTYATTDSLKSLPRVEGRTITSGVVIIEPDIFGVGGKVIDEVATEALQDRLATSMKESLAKHVRTAKNRRQLAELGLEQGIFTRPESP